MQILIEFIEKLFFKLFKHKGRARARASEVKPTERKAFLNPKDQRLIKTSAFYQVSGFRFLNLFVLKCVIFSTF